MRHLDIIITVVFGYYKLDPKLLNDKSRKRYVILPRQICHYMTKKIFKNKYSLSCIGSYMGMFNHATVLHSCGVIQDLLSYDKDFQEDIKEIEKRIYDALEKKPIVIQHKGFKEIRHFSLNMLRT